MNKITTLLFGLIVTLGTTFAQKIDYDNSSKWFLGINLGGTWQTTDVDNRTSVGYGLTLGRTFNYNYGKRVTFDIRGRYLGGYWYGQDYDTTDLSTYTGSILQQYKDSLGFSVNNFQTQVHRLGLELVLHANGLRERSGWDPYIFGGVGFTWYQTYGDLNFGDSTGANYYEYDESQLGKTYVNSLLDGQYETNLEGTSNDLDKWSVGFMPSVGVGIGYQIGKRVTLGIEHKTTFTLMDQFDGYTSAAGGKNDLYHYTSLYMNFRFKTKGNGGSSTGGNNLNNVDNYNQNNLTNNGCISPVVAYQTPASSGIQSSSLNYLVTAEIKDVIGRENIVFKQNGVNNLNFNYNPQTDKFESNVILAAGENTFEITATNTCGSDVETSTVNYVNCQLPVISMVSPSSNGTTVTNPVYNLNAILQNVDGGQITVSNNNVNSTNYNYNATNGSLQQVFTLAPGTNTFVISVTNQCGNDVETVTVNYQNCVAPNILLVTPSANGTTVNNSTFNFSAQLQNATGSQTTLKHNNRSITNFSFNNGTGALQSTLTLLSGLNTIIVSSTNECGTDTETITVNYQNCVAPVISYVTPTTNGSTVNSGTFVLNAMIQNSNNGQGITLKLNNNGITNYSFNNGTGALQSTVTLQPGLNTFVLSSTNACGTDTETITVNFQNCIAPSITIVSPTTNGATVNLASFSLSALIQNSNNGQGISLKQNNINITNYSFNNATGALQSSLTLKPGLNTFVLSVTNACGTDTETITVNFVREVNNVVSEEQKITICHYPPGNTGNPQTIEIPLSAWPAHQAHGDKLGPCPVEEPNTGEGTEEKITICHYPPGNTGNPQTIEIPLSAWPAHQAHGDKLGPCPVEQPNTTGGTEEKITICHYPPGNTDNPQTIEIPLSAWPAHQAHGDKLGPCPAAPPIINSGTEEKITICHYPPGNTGNPQTIEIPLSAWPAHEAHGDKLGPCPVEEPNTGGGTEEKITICHYPPGNTDNPQTIEIPLSAWPAHQAHGDKLGPCPVEEPNTGGGTEEKITICHYPPGNTDNPQTIEIPLSAWPAHQAHGDKLGPCPVSPPIINSGTEEKITICHYPPGNAGNPQTIEIPVSAWPAHEAHGDKLGPCPAEGSVNNENSEEQKIVICHIPPGNTGNPQTIEIPLSAWPAHQAHGDNLGPCPAENNQNNGGNNGHGNNGDGVDSSNPGQGTGGPNGTEDGNGDDENGNNGNSGNANDKGGKGGNGSKSASPTNKPIVKPTTTTKPEEKQEKQPIEKKPTEEKTKTTEGGKGN